LTRHSLSDHCASLKSNWAWKDWILILEIREVAKFNMSLIAKRLVCVAIQDTVYSRQIPRYLESYIPKYIHRYVGIWLSTYYR
jgi:hypothetical protein